MGDKAIYSVDTVETITDNDKIYVNTGDNIKQIKRSDLFIDINSNLSELSKIKKSIIGDGINDLYGTIYFNDNKFPVDIRIVGNTKASNSSYAYLSFEIGGMDFGVSNENAKHFTDQSFDETFTIPSGSYLAFLNQRNVTSNFEIYSSSVVSNVINNVNDSLDDYGLVNQFSGNVVQGYHAPNTGVYDSSYKYAVTDTTKYPCVAGNDVSVKVKGNVSGVFIVWYNGTSYLSYTSDNSLEINAKAPTNATHFTINIQSSSQITPQAISHIGVYIDNAIDKLKNDLSNKFSLVEFTIPSETGTGLNLSYPSGFNMSNTMVICYEYLILQDSSNIIWGEMSKADIQPRLINDHITIYASSTTPSSQLNQKGRMMLMRTDI